MKIVNLFSKQGGQSNLLGPLCETWYIILQVLLVSRPLPIFLKELVKSNMQDIAFMKCATIHKKLGKSGAL